MQELLARQSGVVARRQLIHLGWVHHDVRRLVRRRELVPLARGVYVTHTGRPTWEQRAWAGVLRYWPAALSHASALHAEDPSGHAPDVVDVAVDRNRSLTPTRGIRLRRVVSLDGRVNWQGQPPRVRLEEALVDVATSARSDLDAVGVLADAVRARRTTARRLIATVEGRQRAARREFLAAVLLDIDQGTESVLEHSYLDRVERPHGLPVSRRQVRVGSACHDVLYEEFGQVVELDGRAFHDGAARREQDLGRDLAAAVRGLATVRLGWAQVMEQPCHTAQQVGALLNARGWDGWVRPCDRCG
ncbi:type IV toxin-antitoxin system AbiEi family antitoxin domain-containing protein [Nocardioides jishulii]|uniref:AbiEi antitoxin N-terminal domain-containing protein n=1 Tax=Nocardioides jishulii TaxID=2575440 RepID=A0A4U2YTG9_9ACTN|nr:type IV toxin-antitoxin system AbiEi family antitoxin domain-containing protein [Nocardioides jishulii]QCX26254.1 hypothetical protein FCL41_00885 [Nocardioides jishulii]TKI63942.1 hypothetical protein FC770_01820 [Nocardioides jishulii]